MILTKGHCDPPFLSQLGFGEGVSGWWGGVLEFLGTLELVGEGGLVAVEIGALEVLGALGLVVEGVLVVWEIDALDFLGILELGLEGILVVERVGAIGVLGGLGLGCKEGLWGLSAF